MPAGARQSLESKRAMELAIAGMPVYKAAERTGLTPSNIYKMLNKLNKSERKKMLSNRLTWNME